MSNNGLTNFIKVLSIIKTLLNDVDDIVGSTVFLEDYLDFMNTTVWKPLQIDDYQENINLLLDYLNERLYNDGKQIGGDGHLSLLLLCLILSLTIINAKTLFPSFTVNIDRSFDNQQPIETSLAKPLSYIRRPPTINRGFQSTNYGTLPKFSRRSSVPRRSSSTVTTRSRSTVTTRSRKKSPLLNSRSPMLKGPHLAGTALTGVGSVVSHFNNEEGNKLIILGDEITKMNTRGYYEMSSLFIEHPNLVVDPYLSLNLALIITKTPEFREFDSRFKVFERRLKQMKRNRSKTPDRGFRIIFGIPRPLLFKRKWIK